MAKSKSGQQISLSSIISVNGKMTIEQTMLSRTIPSNYYRLLVKTHRWSYTETNAQKDTRLPNKELNLTMEKAGKRMILYYDQWPQ